MTARVPAGWAWSSDDVRMVGYRVVDIIAEYLATLPQRPVFRPYPGERARSLASEPLPLAGTGIDALLDEFSADIAPYPFGNGHPRFFAWVNSPPHLLGVFAEALAAAMNPSVAGGNHAADLRTDGDPDGVNGPVWFSEFGFDQTRPFRALKVWMVLKHLGLTGYRDLIEHDIAVADRLAAGVAASADLELLSHGLSVVCFRVRPADVEDRALDELNRRVLSAVQLGGRAFLAGTTVDGRFALRACVVNPGSSTDDADAVLAEVTAALREVGTDLGVH